MGTYAWNALSPVTDWSSLCPDDGTQLDQLLHGLTESMLCDDDGNTLLGSADLHPAMFPDDVHCCSNGSAPSTTTTTTTNPGTPMNDGDFHDHHENKGLRLLHLLMAAAEALSGPQKSRELARVILARLKQMVSSHTGDASAAATVSNMERLATHFTDALQALLDGGGGRQLAASSSSHGGRIPHNGDGDVLVAFQMLQDMSPYVRFGHFTANQAILEAVAGDGRVHVVDYDMAAEGVQWAALMQAMATTSRPDDGVPPPHLRITAVSRGGGSLAVQVAGRRLAAFAASTGLPFSFGQCRLDSDERFRPATVRVTKGETLVANCVLSQAAATTTVTRHPSSVASFLAGMATLGAKVVTVVEEEDQGDAIADKDDEAAAGSFLTRFMEELHRYSAVWDSLDAGGFPTPSRARELVERAILAPNIAGALSRANRAADGDGGGEASAGWGEWMRGNGFRAVPLSSFNRSQARLLLGLFSGGYTMEETSPNKIVLGWKARRLLSASVWAPPLLSVPSSPTTEGAFQPMGASPASSGMGGMDFDYIDSFLVEPMLNDSRVCACNQ